MIRTNYARQSLLPRHGLRWVACWLMAAVAASALAAPAPAQVPKSFKYYEDTTSLGFKVKVPADWKFIPASPGDQNLIGKYDGNPDQGVQVPGYAPWSFSVWMVKFDRRKAAGDGDGKGDSTRIEGRGAKTVEEYLPSLGVPVSWKKVDKEGGPLGIAGVEGDSFVYAGIFSGGGNKVPLRLYVAKYKMSNDLDIALIANAPGEEKKWAKFEGALNTMGKSFKKVEALEKIGVAEAKAGDSPLRSKKRAELDAQVKSQPGWSLYETPNYFIISNNPDKEFVDELMVRIEAIRKSYEETYPPEKVIELQKLRDAARAKKKAEGDASGKKEPPEGGEAPADEDEAEGRTSAKGASSLEQSRCSVVRVVQDSNQYHSYGGPSGSAGYWSPGQRELVIYDDKAVGGRRNTWATMNHEAFHQYIFYFFGNLSPHSWYNEGTGDFYAGYQLKNGRFELKPFDWRVSTIKEACRQRASGKQTFIPLKELVRYTQAEYYGKNKYGLDGGENYAQGWSFIWFLRTGSKNARGWNKAWTPILDNYLRALVETDDLDQAVDQAFAGVDFDEMEKAWLDYTLAI